MLLENSSLNQSDSMPYLIMVDKQGATKRYELQTMQVMSIGRASTNRIVLPVDDSCSRHHCEVFHTPSGWKVRDRASRNGTYLNEQMIERDHSLKQGDLIRIGKTVLLFTEDSRATIDQSLVGPESDTSPDLPVARDGNEFPLILHRQKHSTYRRDSAASVGVNTAPMSENLQRLYQMALKMGHTQSAQELADIVLDGLVGLTGADIGAVLMKPDYASVNSSGETTKVNNLVTSSYRSLDGRAYRRVSGTLTQQVFESGEAILAQEIRTAADKNSDRKNSPHSVSLDDIQVESLIVAPISDNQEVYGLIHLYSTHPEKSLDAEGLDYTLAVADQLAIALKNLHQREQLQIGLNQIKNENVQLRHQLAIESELVGQSPAMQRLRETIALVAPTDTVVLIRGESGAGKELVARAIHLNSKRKEAPFVCMNCAALSESLLESELFGHEKGSFTGATGQKQGKFEQAHKGTLFLDEVGEMSPAIQAKFLRVMEGHPFERVGGATTIHVDVRLVAATNRNLEEAVRELKFRKDLYFRLQVLEILVPPLRKRSEDIPILARFFAERLSVKTGRPVRGFTPQAMEKLVTYEWPGNVRELQNTVERAVVLCTGDEIDLQHVQLSKLESALEPLPVTAAAPAALEYGEISIEDLEKEHIQRTLELTQGNKSKASQILGIERSTLDRKLKKYGLNLLRDS